MSSTLFVVCLNIFSSNLVCQEEVSKISPHFKVVFNKFSLVPFKLQSECESPGALANLLTLVQ